MQSWTVGDVKISQIVEQLIPEGLPGLIPDATPDALLAIPWLYPEFITAKGEPSMSLHAFIIDTPTKRIMVDTCIGNDKNLKILAIWDQMQTDFLERMTRAGFGPETIDVVVCTHLHLDHVGWNTMRSGDRWVPTFPNARYLFGRVEYDFLQATCGNSEEDEAWRECNISVERESVRPVIEAGLVDFVEVNHIITDEVRLMPTTGHTPGHVSVAIASGGEKAVITGDSVHHPCQVACPDWGTTADHDSAESRKTRWALFDDACKEGFLVLGTHWTGAGGGKIVRDDKAFRLKFEPTIFPGESGT